MISFPDFLHPKLVVSSKGPGLVLWSGCACLSVLHTYSLTVSIRYLLLTEVLVKSSEVFPLKDSEYYWKVNGMQQYFYLLKRHFPL